MAEDIFSSDCRMNSTEFSVVSIFLTSSSWYLIRSCSSFVDNSVSFVTTSNVFPVIGGSACGSKRCHCAAHFPYLLLYIRIHNFHFCRHALSPLSMIRVLSIPQQLMPPCRENTGHYLLGIWRFPTSSSAIFLAILSNTFLNCAPAISK